MPQRIQRRRTKGWRAPERSVYVGRPSKWGNPYLWNQYPCDIYETDDAKRTAALRDFSRLLTRTDGAVYPSREEIRTELAGKDLTCWCPPGAACHASLLLAIANPGGDL